MTAEWAAKRTFPANLKLDRFKGPKSRESRSSYHSRYIGCYPNGSSDRAELTFVDKRARKRAFRVTVLGVMGKIEVKTGVQRVVE